MGFVNFIIRLVLRLLKLFWRQLRNQVRESFRRISNPDNFFSQSCSASGGGAANPNVEEEKKLWEERIRHQEQLINQNLLFETQGREFSYAWGVLNEAKELAILESVNTNDNVENEDFRWNYFWMFFYMVHKPYSFEQEEGRFVDDLELSTSISLIPDIQEFIILIGEEICKGIAFINHWKFLREELYSLLNLAVESNPISAYVTHACELSSVNTLYPKLRPEVSQEDVSQIIDSTRHVDAYVKSKNNEVSFLIPTVFE